MTIFLRALALVTVRRRVIKQFNHTHKLLLSSSLEVLVRSCAPSHLAFYHGSDGIRSICRSFTSRAETRDWRDMRDLTELLQAIRERKTALRDSETHALASSAFRLATGLEHIAHEHKPLARGSSGGSDNGLARSWAPNRISSSKLVDPVTLAASEVDQMLLIRLSQDPNASLEFLPSLLLVYEALGCAPGDAAQRRAADAIEWALVCIRNAGGATASPVSESRRRRPLGDPRTRGPEGLGRKSTSAVRRMEEPGPDQALCPEFTCRLARSAAASSSESPFLWEAIGRLAVFHAHVLPPDELAFILAVSVSAAAAGRSGSSHNAVLIDAITYRLLGRPTAKAGQDGNAGGDNDGSAQSGEAVLPSGDLLAMRTHSLAALLHALAVSRHAEPRLTRALTEEIGRRLGVAPLASVGGLKPYTASL